MENYESALDVDDSDLPSLLLRPCNINSNKKRKQQNQAVIISLANPKSQTLTSPTRSRIPGPAGTAQAEMDRIKGGEIGDDGSTQERVRRAVDNDGNEDFKVGQWLCAVDFASRKGLLPRITPLSSVPKLLEIGRIDLVVAVIKSCTPNGLGDLMVTLKDPTGIISASIHRKVFVDGEFGKEICVGSVLILQKVAVFAPSRSVVYLNITRSNVVKVISKDSGPLTKQNTYISAVKPDSGHYKETSVNVKEVSSMEVEMTQGINNGIGQCVNLTGSINNYKETVKENNTNFFTRGDQNDSISEQIQSKVFRKEIMADEQRGLNGAADLDKGQNSEGIMRATDVQKEKQPPTATASLPEWTDEQLNELFSADNEDNGFFF